MIHGHHAATRPVFCFSPMSVKGYWKWIDEMLADSGGEGELVDARARLDQNGDVYPRV